MTIAEAVEAINNIRKKRKNSWYEWSGSVNQKKVRLKGYRLWIQRIEVSTEYVDSVVADNVTGFITKLRTLLEVTCGDRKTE